MKKSHSLLDDPRTTQDERGMNRLRVNAQIFFSV